MKTSILNAIAVASLFASPGHALAKGLGAEVTGGKEQGQWGGELGVGYGFDIGPIVIRPIAGAFLYRGDNNRYREDSFSNGQSRCRDTANGQFASSSDCNNVAASFYGKIEAAFTIPALAEVGVGARYSHEKVRPYGLIAVPVAPKVKVAGQVGDHYFSAGVRFGF